MLDGVWHPDRSVWMVADGLRVRRGDALMGLSLVGIDPPCMQVFIPYTWMHASFAFPVMLQHVRA